MPFFYNEQTHQFEEKIMLDTDMRPIERKEPLRVVTEQIPVTPLAVHVEIERTPSGEKYVAQSEYDHHQWE